MSGSRSVILSIWLTLTVIGCSSSAPEMVKPEQPVQAPGVEGMKWLKENGYIKDTHKHSRSQSSPVAK